MSHFLQLSVKLLGCECYSTFWAHEKIIVLSIIIKKFTKKIFPFTSFFPFFSENFSYPKASVLLSVFFLTPSTSPYNQS